MVFKLNEFRWFKLLVICFFSSFIALSVPGFVRLICTLVALFSGLLGSLMLYAQLKGHIG